jgi:hypothetical protein
MEPLQNPSPDGEKARASPEETGFHSAYSDFARNLRLWLLAYGVGLPLVFFESEKAWDALGKDGAVRPFVYLFLSGIGIQILAAIIYKSAMWYLYMGELKILSEKAWRHKVSEWLSTAYWLEFLLDLLTIAAFGIATVRALQVLVK